MPLNNPELIDKYKYNINSKAILINRDKLIL